MRRFCCIFARLSAPSLKQEKKRICSYTSIYPHFKYMRFEMYIIQLHTYKYVFIYIYTSYLFLSNISNFEKPPFVCVSSLNHHSWILPRLQLRADALVSISICSRHPKGSTSGDIRISPPNWTHQICVCVLFLLNQKRIWKTEKGNYLEWEEL